MGYFFFLEGEDSKRICDCSIFKLIGINLIRQSALLCMEFPPAGAEQEYVERVKLSSILSFMLLTLHLLPLVTFLTDQNLFYT